MNDHCDHQGCTVTATRVGETLDGTAAKFCQAHRGPLHIDGIYTPQAAR